MDEQKKQNINQASEQLTDSARQSFQMLADRTVALQESNMRLTQSFFQNFMDQLQNQTEGNRDAAQNLQDERQKQKDAFETISNEATNAYSEFLNSALSFYQETLTSATQVANQSEQQGAQAARQAIEQGRGSSGLKYAGSDRTAAVQLIDELLAEDPSYDEETWPEIAEALDGIARALILLGNAEASTPMGAIPRRGRRASRTPAHTTSARNGTSTYARTA